MSSYSRDSVHAGNSPVGEDCLTMESQLKAATVALSLQTPLMTSERAGPATESHDCEKLQQATLSNEPSSISGDSPVAKELSQRIIQILEEAEFSPNEINDQSEWPSMLGVLGVSYTFRIQRFGRLEDIDCAIEVLSLAVSLTSERDEGRIHWLNSLGLVHVARFMRLGNQEDVQKGIENYIQVIQVAPEGDEIRPTVFKNLGNAHTCRYERAGELQDLDQALEYFTQAVLSTPEGHLQKPLRLEALGDSYERRFERLGEPEDADRAHGHLIQAASLVPEGQANRARIFSSLGYSYQRRSTHHGQVEDITKAVECYRQAVMLTPETHKERPRRLHGLGGSHLSRFERLGELEDIENALEYLTQAASLTPDGHEDKPRRLSSLGGSYRIRFDHLGDIEDIIKAINCYIQAVELTPTGHIDRPRRLQGLGDSYLNRFMRSGELNDINQAIERLTLAVLLTPNEHTDKPGMLNSLGNSYIRRFGSLGEHGDAKKAVKYYTEAVAVTPERHPDKPVYLDNLGRTHMDDSQASDQLEAINKAIEAQIQAVQLTPDKHTRKTSVLTSLGTSYLGRFHVLGELQDIDRSIEYQSQAVQITPGSHPSMAGMLLNLGTMYQSRFQHFDKPEDAEKSIQFFTQSLALLPDDHVYKPVVLLYLGTSHEMRRISLGESADFARAVDCFRAAAESSVGQASVKHQAALVWARLLLSVDPLSSLPAYQLAMELMPQVVWMGSTIERRYEIVHTTRAAVQAAAAAVSVNKFELALEWLEEGRSIVWGQIMQLRTPFDELATVDSTLAQSLKQVAHDLKLAHRRIPNPESPGNHMATLEQATQQHHQLAAKYQKLLDQARTLPGFLNFMRPKKATELMKAAHSGPVIIINVHTERCDALIVSRSTVAHVPLPQFSYAEVAQLHARMKRSVESTGVRERKFLKPQMQPSNEFESILSTLWYKLVKPIFNFLGYIEKRPLELRPHITWCTTGKLSFLPIHAAGCYNLAGDNIFEFAISSYTPTLSAMLVPTPSPNVSQGGILAIGQESTPGLSHLPGTKDELLHIQRHAKGIPYMQLDGAQATAEAVLDAMESYEFVHLACHASQNIPDLTESCFHLHGSRLSLAEIAQKSLKNKSFAFLSACQTATGDMSTPDEAVHLAAGMLVAGYPSVIATMWSISDYDAPLVADRVYEQLTKGGTNGGVKAAMALHVATSDLRAQIGERSFYRWVPYIHMGV